MKSVRLQLLVTLVATAVAAGMFIHRGLPPGMGIQAGARRASLGSPSPAGNIGTVRRNIRWGVDVNAKDHDGRTPLHYVWNRDIAELLIAKGADVSVKDKYGTTPLHLAGNKEIAALLIAKGANVNAKNNGGMTPLHYAYDKNMAELLIAQGLDVNAKDKGGKTPLQIAIEKGHKGVAECLRKHGARE